MSFHTYAELGKPRSEWLCLIDEWVLDETDRAMLRRRYLDGASIEMIAEEYNYSTRQTQRRISHAQTTLLKHI